LTKQDPNYLDRERAPLKSLPKTSSKALGKRSLEQKDIRQKRSLSMGCQKVLEKPFKNAFQKKTEKAFLRGLEREGNRVTLLPFLRDRWRYH